MSSSTSDSDSDSDRGGPDKPFQLPWGLVLTAAIVLVIEATIFARSSRTPPPAQKDRPFYTLDRLPTFEESIVQWQIDYCRHNRQAQDVLLLGDSSCLMGLRPKLIMRQTDLKAHNVGTLSWLQIEGHRELLQLFVENHGPPRLVVYHVSPLTLGFKSPGEYLARLRDYLDPDPQRPWLPSLAYRRTIRNGPLFELIKEDLLGTPRGVFPSDAEVRQILRDRRGAMTERRTDAWSKAPDVRVTLPPYAVTSLEELFRFAGDHRSQVLVMINPLPVIARTADNLASLDRLTTDLRRVVDRFPNAHLFDPAVRFYCDDLCFSVEHVYEAGARRNTQELVRWILDM